MRQKVEKYGEFNKTIQRECARITNTLFKTELFGPSKPKCVRIHQTSILSQYKVKREMSTSWFIERYGHFSIHQTSSSISFHSYYTQDSLYGNNGYRGRIGITCTIERIDSQIEKSSRGHFLLSFYSF